MSEIWKRCGHAKTAENTSGKQCRTCKRASERQEFLAARTEIEVVSTIGSTFTLDQDGMTRADHVELNRMTQGSRRLAAAIQQARAA